MLRTQGQAFPHLQPPGVIGHAAATLEARAMVLELVSDNETMLEQRRRFDGQTIVYISIRKKDHEHQPNPINILAKQTLEPQPRDRPFFYFRFGL